MTWSLPARVAVIVAVVIFGGGIPVATYAQPGGVPAVGDGKAPAAPPAAGIEAQPEPAPVAPDAGEAAEVDPGENKPNLPQNFVPRGEPNAAFAIKDEWVYEPFGGNKRELANAFTKFSLLKVQSGTLPTQADRKVVEEIVRYKLAKFTLKESRDFPEPGTPQRKDVKPVHVWRNELLTDLVHANNAAIGNNGSRQLQDAILEQIVADAPKLFKYHFVARLNAVILLADLNRREAGDGRPAVPYIPAYKPLLDVLAPDKPGTKPADRTPDALRVWAVKGLVRIAEIPTATAELGDNIRFPIVEALIDAFDKSLDSHSWYQMRLAEGLGRVEAFRDRQGRAVIAQALLKAVVDPKRPMVVRVEAARALGRTALDNRTNATLIATKIAQLASEVADDALKANPPPETKLLAMGLYMAFKPVSQPEQIREYGLLMKKNVLAPHQTAIQDAYKQVVPVLSAILNDRLNQLPELNEKLKAWINTNPPKNPRISAEMDPIAGPHAQRAPGAGPNVVGNP